MLLLLLLPLLLPLLALLVLLLLPIWAYDESIGLRPMVVVIDLH